MNEIVADPAKGLDASIAAVPELGQQRDTQAAILAATIEVWQRSGHDRLRRPRGDRPRRAGRRRWSS